MAGDAVTRWPRNDPDKPLQCRPPCSFHWQRRHCPTAFKENIMGRRIPTFFTARPLAYGESPSFPQQASAAVHEFRTEKRNYNSDESDHLFGYEQESQQPTNFMRPLRQTLDKPYAVFLIISFWNSTFSRLFKTLLKLC